MGGAPRRPYGWTLSSTSRDRGPFVTQTKEKNGERERGEGVQKRVVNPVNIFSKKNEDKVS